MVLALGILSKLARKWKSVSDCTILYTHCETWRNMLLASESRFFLQDALEDCSKCLLSLQPHWNCKPHLHFHSPPLWTSPELSPLILSLPWEALPPAVKKVYIEQEEAIISFSNVEYCRLLLLLPLRHKKSIESFNLMCVPLNSFKNLVIKEEDLLTFILPYASMLHALLTHLHSSWIPHKKQCNKATNLFHSSRTKRHSKCIQSILTDSSPAKSLLCQKRRRSSSRKEAKRRGSSPTGSPKWRLFARWAPHPFLPCHSLPSLRFCTPESKP